MSSISNFDGQRAAASIPDDLERKIEEVNLYLVTARDKVEKFKGVMQQRGKEIQELDERRDRIKLEVMVDGKKLDDIRVNFKTRQDELEKLRKEVVEFREKVRVVRAEYETESRKVAKLFSDLKKRENEISSKEATIRIYAKSLDEKERKLDQYNDRIKRMINSLKSD